MREAWSDGPRTYLGLSIAGFPNLFVVAGPGSPSVLANVILSIEQHVDWIADCLDHMRGRGLKTIEASPDAQDAWVEHVNEVAQATLYPRTKSWYLGSNIAGKPEIFMPYVGGLGRYTDYCAGVARDGYAGFALS
jgi:cyclohexanone monooxygenase